MWSCCTEGGLISRFKIIIFRQIHTHSRPIPSRPPPEDRPPARRPTARRSSTTSSSPATGRPSAARSTPAIREIVRHPNTVRRPRNRPPHQKTARHPKTAHRRESVCRRKSIRSSGETKTWSWQPLRQPRISHGPKLGPWETTMPDRDLLRGSIVSHLNHTPPTKRKSHYQGQKMPSAPLTAGKSSCRGRRKPSAPLVVMVFVVRWTRWDFRGCTWYTEYGSEGLLGLGQWTWYRPSKWTWSTKGCQSNVNGRVKNCQGRRRPSAPLAAGKSCCRRQESTSAPLADKTNGCPGRERGLAPLVVMVFVVRWTRWDFRGCTWYTEYGSEGLLGLGQWTWYRPSKWTWSTKGCQSNGNGRVKNCRGRRRPSAPLAAGENSCRDGERAKRGSLTNRETPAKMLALMR